MQFGDLRFLFLLWIVPAMVLLAIYSFRKRAECLRLFCGTELAGRLTSHVHRRTPLLKAALSIMGALAVIVALLQPRWGFHWEEITRKGLDIIVAIDVSESMRAQDVSPNRLERAKREVTDLVEVLQGDRIGLVAFAGVSFLQCPLTLDYGAFKIFLDYLDTDLIPIQGTAIAEAIRTAVKAFVPGRRASRVLIIITDGEDHEGNAEAAAEEAKKNGVKIFPVGIGSVEGAPIPLQDGTGGFKKDRNGQVVLSKLDETSLQKIALATGGSYIRSVTGAMDLRKIYEEQIAHKMETDELKTTMTRKWEERFQWFLAVAFAAFFLEGVLPERKGSLVPRRWWFARRARARSPKALAAALVFFTGIAAGAAPPARADSVAKKIRKGEALYNAQKYDESLQHFLDAQVELPDHPALRFNVGNAYYRMGNYAEAEKAYSGCVISGVNPGLQEKAFYNLGNCAYKQGKLEEAVAYFQKALELDPNDKDAQANLEFVREEIKKRIEEAKKRQEEKTPPQEDKETSPQGKTCPNPQPRHQQGSETAQEQQAAGQQSGTEKTPPGDSARQEQPLAGTGEGDRHEGAGAQATGQARVMTPEEAQRWLNTVSEDQKDIVRQQAQRAFGKRPLPQKDW